MNKELHRMLVELDEKFYDVDLSEYFDFNEEQREKIIDVIVSFFNGYFNSSPVAQNITKKAFRIKRDEAVSREEYEVADILSRTLIKFKEKTFSE